MHALEKQRNEPFSPLTPLKDRLDSTVPKTKKKAGMEPVRDASNNEADRTCAESVTSIITSESPSLWTWICTRILTACRRMCGARASGLSVPRFGQRALGCEAQTRDESESEVLSRINASTSTWSEVPGRFSVQVEDRANASVWADLKKMSPRFFRDDVGDRVVLGRMIGEGGQAEIYEAKFESLDENWFGVFPTRRNYVMKVFKVDAGVSLADLERHWPRNCGIAGTLEFGIRVWNSEFVFGGGVVNYLMRRCVIWCATLLRDGRFAFLMERYWGDLRTLIDLKVKDNTAPGELDLASARGRQQPPFTLRETLSLMTEIADGMKYLHLGDVLHRDLKAANVLLKHEGRDTTLRPFFYACHVADYECAMFVQGTGFWRAPEVLQELQKNERDRNADIWTEKVDVYSYGMTCYEILTSEIPFAGCTKRKWDDVIRGERPPLPTYVDPRLRDLVEKCWHSEPSKRPTFQDIYVDLNHTILL